MVIRVSDKKQNYNNITKLLVNTKFKFITTYQFCFVISQDGISGTTLALYIGTNVSTARLFLGNLRKVH